MVGAEPTKQLHSRH